MGRNDADLELVQQCIAGEVGAWRRFVDRFAPTIRALARRYRKQHGIPTDDPTLDDIVQDVFVALTRRDYRLLRNYDPTYTVKTYLGVITRTEVHRGLRKKRPLLSEPSELEAAAPPSVDTTQAVEESEERETLFKALDELPDRDAEILRLRFLREIDYKGIAARLDIPEASVGQTLYRAKKRLLDKLKGILHLLV